MSKQTIPIIDPAIMGRIIAVSQDAITILDADLSIRYTDPMAAKRMNAEPAKLIGQKITEVFNPLIGADEELEAIARGNSPKFTIAMVNFPGSDEEIRYANITVVPIHPDKPAEGLLLMMQDQSSYGRLQQKLTQQHNELTLTTAKLNRYTTELEAQNAALEVFSQIVAHDLRNPISLMHGYLELLEHFTEDASDQQIDYIRRSEHALDRMANIVDSLLMLTRLRKNDIEIVPLSLDRVAHEVSEDAVYRAKPHKVQITIEKPMPRIMGHHDLLVSVLSNLTENAIKYRDITQDVTRITIRATGAGDMVRIEVVDNGIGIAKESQATLFEMFQRAHAGAAPGFGIGLSIVHQIVRKLGGTVGVESEPGQGSTFWFTLPAPPA